jgi:hypothetical protein
MTEEAAGIPPVRWLALAPPHRSFLLHFFRKLLYQNDRLFLLHSISNLIFRDHQTRTLDLRFFWLGFKLVYIFLCVLKQQKSCIHQITARKERERVSVTSCESEKKKFDEKVATLLLLRICSILCFLIPSREPCTKTKLFVLFAGRASRSGLDLRLILVSAC